MGTPENPKERSIEARKRLIEEGASCYPDAWVALNEFCGEVWGRLTEVLASRLPALSKVLGLKLEGHQLEGHQIVREGFPKEVNEKGFTGKEAWLDVRLKLPEHHLSSLYVGLGWGEGTAEGARPIWVFAGISAKSKAALEKAWPRFQDSQAERDEEAGARDIRFSSDVPNGKVSAFQGMAEKTLDDLIRALKGAGGLKAFRT